MSAPKSFRDELRSHNTHALGMAALSLLAAVVAWNVAYFFFVLILLGLVTSARGDFGARMPGWIHAAAGACAGILLVWGICDQIRRRYSGPTDRQIIGWHLLGDVLLLPVRITLAIGGNLSAVRWLTPEEQDRAWELLLTIRRAVRARVSSLAYSEPDPNRLHRLLTALQMAGYIDLHRGQEDWFYTIPSTRAAELKALENA